MNTQRNYIVCRGCLPEPLYHRRQRSLRRHYLLLEFLMRAARSAPAWLPQGKRRLQLQLKAI